MSKNVSKSSCTSELKVTSYMSFIVWMPLVVLLYVIKLKCIILVNVSYHFVSGLKCIIKRTYLEFVEPDISVRLWNFAPRGPTTWELTCDNFHNFRNNTLTGNKPKFKGKFSSDLITSSSGKIKIRLAMKINGN